MSSLLSVSPYEGVCSPKRRAGEEHRTIRQEAGCTKWDLGHLGSLYPPV